MPPSPALDLRRRCLRLFAHSIQRFPGVPHVFPCGRLCGFGAGKQRLMDTAGRIDKFKKKYGQK